MQEFLKSKLNAEDYFTAEELLNDLIAETEEKGFCGRCQIHRRSWEKNCLRNKKERAE